MSKLSEFLDHLKESGQKHASQLVLGPFLVMTAMLILTFVFPSLHSMVTVMIEFAILALMIVGYSCFVGGMDEHTAKTSKMLVRVALYEFILFITGLPMWKLARRVGSSSIMGAAFVVSVMALLLLTVFLFSETGKKCMNTIDSGFTMNAFSDTEELHPGDLIPFCLWSIRICRTPTGASPCWSQRVIWP